MLFRALILNAKTKNIKSCGGALCKIQPNQKHYIQKHIVNLNPIHSIERGSWWWSKAMTHYDRKWRVTVTLIPEFRKENSGKHKNFRYINNNVRRYQ